MTHSHSVQTDSQNTIPDLIRRVRREPGLFIRVQVMSSAVDVVTLVSNIIIVVQ